MDLWGIQSNTELDRLVLCYWCSFAFWGYGEVNLAFYYPLQNDTLDHSLMIGKESSI